MKLGEYKKGFIDYSQSVGLRQDLKGGTLNRDIDIKKLKTGDYSTEDNDIVFFNNNIFMTSIKKIENKVAYKLFGDS